LKVVNVCNKNNRLIENRINNLNRMNMTVYRTNSGQAKSLRQNGLGSKGFSISSAGRIVLALSDEPCKDLLSVFLFKTRYQNCEVHFFRPLMSSYLSQSSQGTILESK
jgi:hypothetical protein